MGVQAIVHRVTAIPVGGVTSWYPCEAYTTRIFQTGRRFDPLHTQPDTPKKHPLPKEEVASVVPPPPGDRLVLCTARQLQTRHGQVIRDTNVS